ncbi:Peripheral plasma membrane protein CASK [Liparis tanakae]|uniref:Peripheral plasma membrane protein CASK n=1 Tax=Liparis tanakae TaxID=230148 RepID=A0A4Z2I7K4_9TELE|nr:Peripheral plasma membrane protein CASK [Liparis tanakae]
MADDDILFEDVYELCEVIGNGGRQLCCRDERAGHQTTGSHARAHIWSRLVTGGLTLAPPSSAHCKDCWARMKLFIVRYEQKLHVNPELGRLEGRSQSVIAG